jgi:hypothetical protein
MRLTPRILTALVLVSLAGACTAGSDDTDDGADDSVAEATVEGSAQDFPDVIAVDATKNGDDWTFAVTLSSPYDSPEQYADAWRVVGPDGTVYGERLLTHDHASEQPFTRSQTGITIPDDVRSVTVEARDSVNGWGGSTIDHELPDGVD